MHALPRPLPPRSSFVTVMAWLSLAVALMSAAGSALQALGAMLMPPLADLGALLPPDTPLPAPLVWLGEHLVGLSLLGMLLSLGMAWISWALLQRREWARLAFIAVLVLVALANFACIPLADAMVSMAVGGISPHGGGDAGAQLVDMGAPLLAAARTMAWIGSVAIALVHGGIVWQLCRPAIRAEFRS